MLGISVGFQGPHPSIDPNIQALYVLLELLLVVDNDINQNHELKVVETCVSKNSTTKPCLKHMDNMALSTLAVPC